MEKKDDLEPMLIQDEDIISEMIKSSENEESNKERMKRKKTYNFSFALAELKVGYKMCRRGWNGKGMYVVLKPGYMDGIEANEITRRVHGFEVGTRIVVRPYLEMYTADHQLVPWVASQTDILADDWCYYEA